MRSFTSKPSQASENRTYPFELDGEVFTITVRADDADFAMEYSDMATIDTDADLMSAEGVAFVARFFRLMLGDDYPRFRAHLRAERHVDAPAKPHDAVPVSRLGNRVCGVCRGPVAKTGGETIAEIMRSLNDAIISDEEEDADRPTAPSAGSSRGRRPRKGARTSELRSLAGADGEVLVVPDGDPRMSPELKAERAAQRELRDRTKTG